MKLTFFESALKYLNAFFYIREQNIIPHGLQLSNVLMLKDEIVKISDFGLLKLINKDLLLQKK
jgi:hypothetical protein